MIPTNASYRQASPRRGIVQPTQKVIGVASKGAHNRLKYQQQRHQAGAASSHSPAGTHSTNDETPPSTSEREYPSSRPASSDQAKIRPSSSPPKSRSKSRSGSRTRSHQLHGDEGVMRGAYFIRREILGAKDSFAADNSSDDGDAVIMQRASELRQKSLESAKGANSGRHSSQGSRSHSRSRASPLRRSLSRFRSSSRRRNSNNESTSRRYTTRSRSLDRGRATRGSSNPTTQETNILEDLKELGESLETLTKKDDRCASNESDRGLKLRPSSNLRPRATIHDKVPQREPAPVANNFQKGRFESWADQEAYLHAQSAGTVWRSLIGEQIRFPKHWYGGAKYPPMLGDSPGSANCWHYVSNLAIQSDEILAQCVSNRTTPGKILLHLVIRGLTGAPIRHVVIGVYHPNAEGVRDRNKSVRHSRRVWMAVRRCSALDAEGSEEIQSRIDAVLLHGYTLEEVSMRNPLIPKKGNMIDNGNLRAVYGECAPLETAVILEQELYQVIMEAAEKQHPSSSKQLSSVPMALLQAFFYSRKI